MAKGQRPSGNNGKRAKHLVREGARARAVASLTTSVADLTLEDEQTFAAELLPQSSRPEIAVSDLTSLEI